MGTYADGVRRTVMGVVAVAAMALGVQGAAGVVAQKGRVGAEPAVPAAAPKTQVVGLHPSELVGFWRVSGKGVAPKTYLRLSPDDLMLFDDSCIWRIGGWEARPSGLFVGGVRARHASCADAPNPAWLGAAVSFRPDGAARQLLDAEGRVSATLRPSAGIAKRPDMIERSFKRPVVSPEERAQLDVTPAPAPPGLVPATRENLVGRWIPVLAGTERKPDETYVDLRGDGAWDGCEQCNEAGGGRWSVGDGGSMAAYGSWITLVGCRAIDVTSWLDRAAWAGFAGPVLVLVGPDGQVLGQLVRSAGG